jgi:ribosomal protein L11 methyltransferase
VTVLDLGTGSGVLARGVNQVCLSSATSPRSGSGDAPMHGSVARRHQPCATGRSRAITAAAPYDLIFANILLGPLLRLAVPLRRLAGANARIVLSGLLPAHANAVLAAYRMQGLALERRITLDGWVTLVLRCP